MGVSQTRGPKNNLQIVLDDPWVIWGLQLVQRGLSYTWFISVICPNPSENLQSRSGLWVILRSCGINLGMCKIAPPVFWWAHDTASLCSPSMDGSGSIPQGPWTIKQYADLPTMGPAKSWKTVAFFVELRSSKIPLLSMPNLASWILPSGNFMRWNREKWQILWPEDLVIPPASLTDVTDVHAILAIFQRWVYQMVSQLERFGTCRMEHNYQLIAMIATHKKRSSVEAIARKTSIDQQTTVAT